MTIDTLLLVFALVCFLLSALKVDGGPVSLLPLGLAAWVATLLF